MVIGSSNGDIIVSNAKQDSVGVYVGVKSGEYIKFNFLDIKDVERSIFYCYLKIPICLFKQLISYSTNLFILGYKSIKSAKEYFNFVSFLAPIIY